MKVGLAKIDITPRCGVELTGFGPFLHRYSIAIRDDLWAKAFAIEQAGKRQVIVSCDLLGLQAPMIEKVKATVKSATGLVEEDVMVHCTHTHSGPTTSKMSGWGEMDFPYLEILPYKIAQACIDAIKNLQEAKLSHSEVPCEGIGQNRVYEKATSSLEDVLSNDWRPEKPELTDTSCHVIKVESQGKIIGFLAYFGCHPVVCCAQSHYIHGDFPGVALNNLEREFPGSIGLFLQGAQGDVNSCVVHKTEQEALLALNVIASRFANVVREGLKQAKPIGIEEINSAIISTSFTEKKLEISELEKILREKEDAVHKQDVSDSDHAVRMEMVYIAAYRQIISLLKNNKSTYPKTKIQGFKIGPIVLLGSPFETFQAIKNDVKAAAKSPIPLVMSFTNDYLGYAIDKQSSDGYEGQIVPIIQGRLPLKKIHEELVQVLLELEKELIGK
ncbi:MAG: neutral/alkaline non-lysosomal ceramidase N-terminal domain-containing protein [Lentisphaeria bacterium]